MNELQKRLLLTTQIKEKMLTETFIDYPEEYKKLQQILLHKNAMEEFKRLGEEGLSSEPCSTECFFCYPDLLLKSDQELSNI